MIRQLSIFIQETKSTWSHIHCIISYFLYNNIFKIYINICQLYIYVYVYIFFEEKNFLAFSYLRKSSYNFHTFLDTDLLGHFFLSENLEMWLNAQAFNNQKERSKFSNEEKSGPPSYVFLCGQPVHSFLVPHSMLSSSY